MYVLLNDRGRARCSSGPGRHVQVSRAGARLALLALASGTLTVAAATATTPAPPAFAAAALSVPCSSSSLVLGLTSVKATGGTLTLASGCTYTLTAANNGTDGGTGLPVITGKVTVQGNGATIRRSTTSGTAAFRLFDVASVGSLTLNGGLTLSNGLADDGANGGGAIDSHGMLSVSGVTFSGNQSPAATGTSGGAINSSGTLTVTGSTFSGNTAQEGGGIFNQKTATITNTTFTGDSATIYGGGGLLNAAGSATVTADTFSGNSGSGGGAIDNDASLKISDSTFTGNSAGNNGGGAIQNFGTTAVTQSTVAGNSSPYGANVLNYTGFSLTLTMSIVAGGQVGPNCGGEQPVIDGGYNIDTGSTCGFSAANHSMSNTQPQLGPLASNGGPTQTMALPVSSPAVDAISAATTGCTGGTDQRGVSRPQGSGCDVGAYELVVTSGTAPSIAQSQPVTVTTPAPAAIGVVQAGAQVLVSDNVNGTWTRASASTTFSGGTGDIALYYVQNSAAAP
jgi:hypothetical protein